MKPIKYVVLDEEDFRKCDTPLKFEIINSYRYARAVKRHYDLEAIKTQEELSHNDIDIELPKFHIYKLERVH